MTSPPVKKRNSKRARVLLVVQGLGIGGTERAAATYASLYARIGCDVTVYGIYSGGPIQAMLEVEGICAVSGFPAITDLLSAAKIHEYDLIHVNAGGPYDPVVDTILSALKGPTTRVIQTNVFARSDYGPPGNLVDLELLISFAGHWKWSAHSRSSQRKRPAAILPYLVPEERFYLPSLEQQSAARKHLGVPVDVPVFGRIGQPSMNKWDPRLVEVCVSIVKQIANAHFVFVGCPPTLKARLERKTRLRNKISFFPPSASDQELQLAYSAMDVFLHLSRIGESFGLVLVEAAQTGLPIATLATPLKDDAQGEIVGRMHAGAEAWTTKRLASLAIQLAGQARADNSLRCRISLQANRCFGASFQIESFETFFNEVMSLDANKLASRSFCNATDQQSGSCLVKHAETMRLERQAEVLRRRGILYWLAFQILYLPRVYRFYRKLQERRYLARQRERASEIRRLLAPLLA